MSTGGGGARLRKALKALEGREVRVGWFEDAEYPDGTKVASIAYIQEHGAIRKIKSKSDDTKSELAVIPPRMPLRISAETQMEKIGETINMLVIQAAETGEIDQGLNRIGALAASHVKDVISSNLPPPNAESTVDGMLLKDKEGKEYRAGSSPDKGNRKFGQGKGSSRTLIDTGQMLKTVQWEIK